MHPKIASLMETIHAETVDVAQNRKVVSTGEIAEVKVYVDLRNTENKYGHMNA